jgi:hypothetical protein
MLEFASHKVPLPASLRQGSRGAGKALLLVQGQLRAGPCQSCCNKHETRRTIFIESTSTCCCCVGTQAPGTGGERIIPKRVSLLVYYYSLSIGEGSAAHREGARRARDGELSSVFQSAQ